MKDIFLSLSLVVTILVMGGLLVVEVREWLGRRGDPKRSGAAAQRLARRATGVILLPLVLILLKWPSVDSLTPIQQFYKLLGCLALCVLVFAIAIWDFRIMRKEVKNELRGFVDESAQAIQNHLSDIEAKDPEFKKKLTEMAAKDKKASSES